MKLRLVAAGGLPGKCIVCLHQQETRLIQQHMFYFFILIHRSSALCQKPEFQPNDILIKKNIQTDVHHRETS